MVVFMIKIQSKTATREPLPSFLRGLAPESLADLSWTDPQLGVSDAAWWPEEDQSAPLGEFERYGDETLTVDAERRVVIVTRAVVPLSDEEIEAATAERRAEMAQQIADRRWQAEVAGITVNGMAVATDRDSQALITGAALAAMRDPAYVCRWKTATGFVELNAEQLTAVADTVRAHVQACFDREAALLVELDGGTLTAEMIETGWPA
jgi:hypothetical protein